MNGCSTEYIAESNDDIGFSRELLIVQAPHPTTNNTPVFNKRIPEDLAISLNSRRIFRYWRCREYSFLKNIWKLLIPWVSSTVFLTRSW